MTVKENSSKGNRKYKEPSRYTSPSTPNPPPTVNLNVNIYGEVNAPFVIKLSSGRDFSFTFYDKN